MPLETSPHRAFRLAKRAPLLDAFPAMPEPVLTPFCVALALGFAGRLLGLGANTIGLPQFLGNLVEDTGKDIAKDALKKLIRLAGDTSHDPATGLPRNHDLQRASRDALREAVLVVVLELAGQLDPQKPWLPAILDHIRAGRLFDVPLIEARDDPQRRWLEAFRLAVTSDRFDAWHDGLLLGEDDVRRCFQGDQCRFAEVLTPRMLAWTRAEVQAGREPPGFEPLVREGWEIPGGSGRITLEQSYCLFFREHLKHRPEVFRIYVADTLGELLKRQAASVTTAQLEATAEGLHQRQDDLAAVQRTLTTKADLAAFGEWLDPQLGELKTLLADVAAQLQSVATGQRELSDQQGQLLVAFTTLSVEMKRGHDTASATLAALTRFVGQVERAFQRLERRLFGLPLSRPAVAPRPPRGENASDLWILKARHRSLPLVGRDDDMASLWSWLHSPHDISVRLVVGNAGAGKTRLGYELLWRVARELGDAWDAGRVNADDLRKLTDLHYSTDWAWTKPTLVLVDYARASHDALRKLLTELARRAGTPGLPPFRLLLLERTPSATPDWLESLFRLESADGGVPAKELFHPPEPHELRSLDSVEQKRGLFAAALQCVAEFRGEAPLALPAPGTDPAFEAVLTGTKERDDWRDPLVPLMAALVAQQRRHLAAVVRLSRTDIAFALTHGEADRVEKFVGHSISQDQRALLRHVAAVAVLAGGLSAGDARTLARAELDALQGQWPGDAFALAAALCRAWPAVDHGIAPLQPDLVAEAFVIEWLVKARAREVGLACVRRTVARHETAVAGLILRAFHNFGSLTPVAETLAQWAVALAEDAATASDPALLAALDAAMPHSTTALRASAARVTEALYRRLKAAAPDDRDLPGRAELARVANNLGVRLSDAGRRADALAPAQEAVDLRRALAHQNQNAFTPVLAISLNNLATFLSELGRRADVLAPAQEAVDLRRGLARQNSDAFTPALAGSLNTLATSLSKLGRRADALVPAQEAVDLYRALARQNRDAFTPALAMSLNNFANRLGELGRRADALAAAQEAVDLRRALARQNPDAFTPALAMSLNNLAGRLSELGRRADALASAQEAVDLHRTLARQNPDAFVEAVAKSLWRLSLVLSGLERHEEAAATLTESVRGLVPAFTQLPQAFAPLIQALGAEYLRVIATLGREPDFAGAEAFLVPVAEGLQALAASEPPAPYPPKAPGRPT